MKKLMIALLAGMFAISTVAPTFAQEYTTKKCLIKKRCDYKVLVKHPKKTTKKGFAFVVPFVAPVIAVLPSAATVVGAGVIGVVGGAASIVGGKIVKKIWPEK